MKTHTLILIVLSGLTCHVVDAQDESKVDWDAEYKQLLESDPGVRNKIEAGQATKEDIIQWLQQTRGENTKSVEKEPAPKTGKRDLSAFRKTLGEFVKSGKLTQEEATKLFATMKSEESSQEDAKEKDAVDWDAEYEKLLEDPAARQKIENSGATKEQVIQFLKQRHGVKGGKGKSKVAMKGKRGARKGSVNFYAIVVGKLKSKDIELGELELEIDYIHSQSDWAKKELVGKRVKLVGVAGAFLDNLLRIKRGETVKIRTGDYNRETKVLGFGYKFQVLERTAPFNPADFGVAPQEFRGFRGELVGKVVEAQGYEVLLEVQKSKPADGNKAKDAQSILGKRIRIAEFYNQHADAFADLHEGDKVRVSVAHRNSENDALNVTDVLEKVEK